MIKAALFQAGYDHSRRVFREEALLLIERFPGAKLQSLEIPSKTDSDLTTDLLYVPPRHECEGLVIVVSGVHGAEGATGAAVQRWMMHSLFEGSADSALPTQKTGYLFVHAMNPHGFRYGRRVTENGVDLNRNFLINPSEFSKTRPHYQFLTQVINPVGKAKSGVIATLGRAASFAPLLRKMSVSDLRKEVTRGQYQEPRGIFFGGSDYEPQLSITVPAITEFAMPFRKVMIFDVHTGYGERGVLHLFPNPPRNEKIAHRFNVVFDGTHIDQGDANDFFESEGDCVGYLSEILEAAGKETVPMVLEFGTLDSQNLIGVLDSLERIVLENQAHHHGAASPDSHRTIRRKFRALFLPEDVLWREAVVKQTATLLPKWVERFVTAI